MSPLPFVKSVKARNFCHRIAEALVAFAGKEEAEASELIGAYFGVMADIEEEPLIFHECPYYHAMCILHHPVLGDGNVMWYKDPSLWPPPAGWVFG